MATIKDVALLARVSTGTVSNVLNNNPQVGPEIRERVMRVVSELNFHPNALARSLKTKHSKTAGMVVTDIMNPFYPAVVRGAEDVLASAGYMLIVGNSDGDVEKEDAYYRLFASKRVDGLLLITRATAEPPVYLFRHNWEPTPVVFINRIYRGLRADSVLADNLEGSRQAVGHLLESGHRRIGIITGPAHHTLARERLLGYETALGEHGLLPAKELIREGCFDIQSGYEEAKVLLSLHERPTALFVCNVPMTMGCLRAIFGLGLRCPEQIALVSFDDSEWFDVIRPRISAVAQPAYQLGEEAAKILLKRISGEITGPPFITTQKTKLLIRESSGWELHVSAQQPAKSSPPSQSRVQED